MLRLLILLNVIVFLLMIVINHFKHIWILIQLKLVTVTNTFTNFRTKIFGCFRNHTSEQRKSKSLATTETVTMKQHLKIFRNHPNIFGACLVLAIIVEFFLFIFLCRWVACLVELCGCWFEHSGVCGCSKFW